MPTKTAARTAKSKNKKSKTLPVCTAKDLRKKKSKRRKCTVPVKTKPSLASPTGPVATAINAPWPGPINTTPAYVAPVSSPAPAQPAIPTTPAAPSPVVPVEASTPTETAVPPAEPTSPPAEPTASPLDEAARTSPGGDGLATTTPSEPATTPAQTTPTSTPPAVVAPAAPLPTTATSGSTLVYAGPFSVAQANRLLHRAGFGAKPGEAEALAALGLRGAVDKILNPGTPTLSGPAPSGGYLVNGAFAPTEKRGHMHLQLLDRQVRTNDGLAERMVMVLHDWFGVAERSVRMPMMWEHLNLLRSGWRGSFRTLLQQVAVNRGMLTFLDGVTNTKVVPNENFARELMELFTLGANRGAYTEADVRELARTQTGWINTSANPTVTPAIRFEPTRFDGGTKTVFAGTAYQRTGNLTGIDGINAVVDHPLHPSFVVTKLWSYFVPTAPSAETVAHLSTLYRESGEALVPVLEAIFLHPDLYSGGSMAKSPMTFLAGLLRGLGMGIATDAWWWKCEIAGELVGAPPSVAGWNRHAWLGTSTYQNRWNWITDLLWPLVLKTAAYEGREESPAQAVDAALAFWGTPVIGSDHRALLMKVASKPWPGRVAGDPYLWLANFLTHRQNTLRQLVPAAPDFQVT